MPINKSPMCQLISGRVKENKKGCFWDGRFKSQALLDETALLSCMAYVDLNPVRTGITNDLNTSDFTSIQRRIYDYSTHNKSSGSTEKSTINTNGKKLLSHINKQEKLKFDLELHDTHEAPFMSFGGSRHTDIHRTLPFTQEDYFDLVDTTGRIIREGKRGFIAEKTPKLIQQLGIDPKRWIDHINCFRRRYAYSAGSTEKLTKFADLYGRQWAKGVSASRIVYRH